MNIKAQIEFKSTPDMFDKEYSGIKNNIVYFVNRKEDKEILATINNIKSIRIINTNDIMCETSFVRTITDITRYVNPADLKIIYIFTWKR
jgi:hypothetical protein